MLPTDMKIEWNRREFLQGAGSAFAVGAAMAGAPGAVKAQSPAVSTHDDEVSCITTTAETPWQAQALAKPGWRWDALNLNVDLAVTAQTMEGFGGCFNELGWTSLSKLSDGDRESVLRELFDPVAGARFSLCRMPIGANDFALKAYSYDETKGDFELKHFSIENDKATLIPFIHAAQRYQPKLRVWASPWSPPSWMKRNGFYAEAAGRAGMKDNGIRPDQVGHEGEDMFILEEPYLAAYAKYFGRFVDAYKAEGIRVGMVMPQNEFNSAQNFPSCTWTPAGLAKFLRHLGPEMSSRDVAVFFGTLERGDPEDAGVGDGRSGGGEVHQRDGSAVGGEECAARAASRVSEAGGVSVGTGVRGWVEQLELYGVLLAADEALSVVGGGWVSVLEHFNGPGWDEHVGMGAELAGQRGWGAKSFRYNHDYYLMKHLSHFVEVGAKRVETTGTCDDALGFLNPDGGLVLLLRNELQGERFVEIRAGGRIATVRLLPDSISTVTMRV